ncbi:MAG: polyprenyl synthetase family protein [Saprospiraceae bacterium]|nr:polyprenyl synthetase family protein [Saprospiraceae bacterium]
MIKSLSIIQEPINAEIKEFHKRFKQAMKSDFYFLDIVTNFIIRRKGKQMRPMFIFLSAKICGEINNLTYHAANLIELLHTATLIHDDVVDESMQRRGFFSLNALWGNKIPVLVGDYLLSKGLLLSIEHNAFDLLKITSNAVKEMSEGELLQIVKARRLDINEEIYFEIIRKKTASLIASACASGAASTTKNQSEIQKMHTLGEKIGIAFQIRDDLFDFGDGDAGKPQGNDIQEKKMTLPLIQALNSSSKKRKNYIINIIKNENTNPKKIKEVTDFVLNSPGIEYARKMMYQYREEAYDLLNTFPSSPSRESMKDLISYVTERKK